MAQKYVLGPNAARELKRLMHGSGGVSRRSNFVPSLAFDSEFVAPFTVRWSASSVGGGGAWIIWLPDESIVSVDGETVDPTGDLESVGGDYPDGWYVLSDEMLGRDDGGRLRLNITRGSEPECEFSSSDDDPEDGEVSVVICETTVDSDSGERSVRQFVSSSVVIGGGHEPDKISTDIVTADDAEDPNALQIKDFDNDESDSEQGLTQRIEVVKDGDGDDATYHLEAKDHEGEVFLLARVNGKIRYIPLTGTVEDEEEEEKPETESSDPCRHPGSEESGGVSPDGDAAGHGGTSDADGQTGGVPADGDAHEGKACTGTNC